MARTKRRVTWNIIFIGIFVFFSICFLLSVKDYFRPAKFSEVKPQELKDDEFDPSLLRLNTMTKLGVYCDSIYAAKSSAIAYPEIVSEIVRKKFYHGYCYYNTSTNPMASFLSLVTGKGASAIVMADDIVKFPFGACSQQSIVCMDLVKRKGYDVRKITMYDGVTKQGHFTFEVFFNNDWHFFDTDMEPDAKVLQKYNRPSVTFLKAHPEVTASAYRKKNPILFERLINSARIGAVNKNPAPVASLLQLITKYLNYFGWLLAGVFLLVRNRLLARNSLAFTWLKRKNIQFQTVNAAMQGHEARA